MANTAVKETPVRRPADGILNHFNILTGKKIKPYEKNIRLIEKCLRLNGGDEDDLAKYIKWYCLYKNDQDMVPDFDECMTDYCNRIGMLPTDDASESSVSTGRTNQNRKAELNTDPFGLLGQSMAGMFEKMLTETLEGIRENMLQELKSEVKEELGEDVKSEIIKNLEESWGEKVQKIKLEFEDGRPNPIEDEVVHEKLNEILNFIMAKEPVYLVGPTGCGKNHICKQIAKILELPFYFSNAITQEYKLIGFTDANGVYQETQFYKAFKNGGIFMLDEMDASVPEALIVLNSAIANGYFDFPAPIGYVEAHPDFRVVAAGNTYGNGADIKYVGRNQLDMASLDRFAVVYMDYSLQVEKALCPDVDLLTFLREYRKSVYKNGIMTVVSYRAFKRIYMLEDEFDDLTECLDSCLCKGLKKDDLLLIHKQIKSESRYKDALHRLANSREEL